MSKVTRWIKRLPIDYSLDDRENAMLAEIADLRAALSLAQDSCESNANAAEDYYREKQSLLDQRENWRCLAAKFEQERDKLKVQLQELNLQYISDFGQLQEREPTKFQSEKRLSVDDLDDIADNLCSSFSMSSQIWTFTNDNLFKFARAIEEAHNIKE